MGGAGHGQCVAGPEVKDGAVAAIASTNHGIIATLSEAGHGERVATKLVRNIAAAGVVSTDQRIIAALCMIGNGIRVADECIVLIIDADKDLTLALLRVC